MAEEKRPIYALGDLVRTNVYGVPEPEEGTVSVGFFHVKRFEDSELTPDQLVSAIKAAEEGEFNNVSIERLRQGPSYIELGGWVGDQGTALQLMGLGEILGLWEVATPARLGIEGDQAQEMMGMGFVMVAPRANSPLFA